MAKTVKKFYLDEEIFDILVNEKFDDNGKSIEKKEEKDKETVEVTKLMLKNRKRLNAFSQYIYEYTSAKNFYLSYYRILFEYLTTKKYNEGYRKEINDIKIEITKVLEDKSDDTNVFMSFLKTFQTIQKIVLFLNGISSYIKDKTQTNENDNQEDNSNYPKTMYVNVEAVYIRERPTTESSAVASVGLNTPVTVNGEEGEWYKVHVTDGSGYMMKKYLSEQKN